MRPDPKCLIKISNSLFQEGFNHKYFNITLNIYYIIKRSTFTSNQLSKMTTTIPCTTGYPQHHGLSPAPQAIPSTTGYPQHHRLSPAPQAIPSTTGYLDYVLKENTNQPLTERTWSPILIPALSAAECSSTPVIYIPKP